MHTVNPRTVGAVQERLLALSRRARRALEKELQVSHGQRSSGAALNRSNSAHPAAGQGMSRDASRPQEGPRAADRRNVRAEAANARQRDLSDRAIRVLEELSSLGRQVNCI